MSKKNTIFGFILVCVFFYFGAKSLVYNLTPLFEDIDESISNGQTIVMNGDIDASKLENLLIEGGYISDSLDAKLISRWYASKIPQKELKNLGAINGYDFGIPIDSVLLFGGEELKSRCIESFEILGQTEEWKSIDKQALSPHFRLEVPEVENYTISVSIVEKTRISGFIDHDKTAPVPGVTVRITEHWINDSIPSENLRVSHEDSILGYAVTDAQGKAYFSVPAGHFYSVLPISEGFQYGSEKGTTQEALSENEKFSFSQREHKITPLKSITYNYLKKNKALVSRSPQEFKDALNWSVILFLVSWFCVFICTWVADRCYRRSSDSGLLLVLMALSGIGILAQFGAKYPLTDIFDAYKTATIIPWGCGLLVFLSCFNYLKLYQKYRAFYVKKGWIGSGRLSSNTPCLLPLLLAILLMVALGLLGTGPDGSDAKVNLWGIFQPSEVVKYLVVIVIALFFAGDKAETIKTYGERLPRHALGNYLGIFIVSLAVIILVCIIFLLLLKDMGPAIVILATFILLYSVVRRDTEQLMWGIISYMVVVGLAYMISESVLVRALAMALWFLVWGRCVWLKRRTIYESAILFNILISVFLMGGYMLQGFAPHMADRLFNRTGMAWAGIFDNAIPQGDQIAQGLWGIASGRFSGMGLGGGSSYFIPAGHTDLILSSIGEQMGWLGIFIIVICFFILIKRTVDVAKYSGHMFTMLLCLGIGLLTGVQFLIIALGCVGVIPLTGVPAPLLSCSRTGLVMTLAAYGVVIAISRHRGSDEALRSFVVNDNCPQDDILNNDAKSLNQCLSVGIAMFFIGSIIVLGRHSQYQLLFPAQTQIRPAITANENGLRVLEYNPRIRQVTEMLERGNIYDRNGLLLATSDRADLDSIKAAPDTIRLAYPYLDKTWSKRARRYYPFGNQLVFMVGDINHPTVYTNYTDVPIGYLAENENADFLTGIDTDPRTIELQSSNYKFHRFVKPVGDVTSKYKLHDYSFLIPALAYSPYRNGWIDEFNQKRQQRDIRLTVDADLQTKLQNAMANNINTTANLKQLPNLRASVVVLDAQNGDLIASANYPLPETDSIIKLRATDYYNKSKVPSECRPGKPITERDLGLTFQTVPGSTAKVMTALAGFKKLKKKVWKKGFEIQEYMCVERPGVEPYIGTPKKNRRSGKRTYIDDAIKHSSNCYFIMLLNEENLYHELGDVYWAVGASLNHQRSYFLNMDEIIDGKKSRFDSIVNIFQSRGLVDYRNYMNRTPKPTKWERNSNRMTGIQEFTGIAWGQSRLEASPLNMARTVSIVANGGKLAPTRFVLDQPEANPMEIIDSESAALLAHAMKGEASRWNSKDYLKDFLANDSIGGKTGTPERVLGNDNKNKPNDAWYICFVKNNESGKTYSIALRLERLPKGNTSKEAVEFMANAVLPVLRAANYIK